MPRGRLLPFSPACGRQSVVSLDRSLDRRDRRDGSPYHWTELLPLLQERNPRGHSARRAWLSLGDGVTPFAVRRLSPSPPRESSQPARRARERERAHDPSRCVRCSACPGEATRAARRPVGATPGVGPRECGNGAFVSFPRISNEAYNHTDSISKKLTDRTRSLFGSSNHGS